MSGGGGSPARLSTRRPSLPRLASGGSSALHRAAPPLASGSAAGRRALLLLLGAAAAAVLLVWRREARVLQRVSGALDARAHGGGGSRGNGTGDADDGALWDLRGLLRQWVGGDGQQAEHDAAESDAAEVESDGATADEAPIGAEHLGDAAPGAAAATAAATAATAVAPEPPSPPPARPAGLPAYAQLPYAGPATLGGTPDPNEAAWLLPAAPGVDVQIRRDLAPWRRGGITMADLRAQKSGGAKLRIATEDSVWEQPPGLFSCVIWRNVPYFYVSEVKTLLKKFLFGAVLKIADFLRLLFNVAKHTKLPNTVFLWNADPWPLLKGKPSHGALAPRPSAPVLSLCKTDTDWDVLYPSMYFKSLEFWTNVTASIGAAATAAQPWRSRLAKVWWRGSAGKFWPGSQPRVFTVGTYWRKPWADLAFTDQWQYSVDKWEGTALWRTFPPGMEKVPNGKPFKMSMEQVAKYKYALHLPGFYYATYSRMLQFLLWSGAAVFVYDCPYYEFYYHRLRPWVHYIPTNLTQVEARFVWAEAHPAEAAAISGHARDFAKAHIGPRAFIDYWGQLLGEYNKLLGFKLSTPPRGLCTCWPGAAPGRRYKPAWLLPGAVSCGVLCSDKLIIKTGMRVERRRRAR